MYLARLNDQWSSFAQEAGLSEAAAIRITNTAQLKPADGPSYWLEFEREGRRFHLYHLHGLPGHADDLRELSEAYADASPEAAFGIPERQAAAIMEAVHAFMQQHYAAIQTSVDCGNGIEQARSYIHNVRMKHWLPRFPS
ncbi:hypothetical protein [Paenibacillus sacheonensis]|uniref:Uncharacterized protein n=1 Tax=Paenibacillus sacheonensis TaxID=742054 RepID=A0A7X4YL80_9BACL|nr:hypothetical protein [Paenibacillus sacheonensis]MBM7563958.1 hypothetical protein [Paenibacillus sacheonensis]NBC67701.1 hypothetical protein [Paenibacillus sacheonensis]